MTVWPGVDISPERYNLSAWAASLASSFPAIRTASRNAAAACACLAGDEIKCAFAEIIYSPLM
jgi:hypothetical protein